MSVTTGSISAALLGVAGHAHRHWSTDFTVGGCLGGWVVLQGAMGGFGAGVGRVLLPCSSRQGPGTNLLASTPTRIPNSALPPSRCSLPPAAPSLPRRQVRAVGVRVLALVMMAISIAMAAYAAYNFKRRGDMLV